MHATRNEATYVAEWRQFCHDWSMEYKTGASTKFPELEEFLWGSSFWADGYFAESVGVKNESTIRQYINDQS